MSAANTTTATATTTTTQQESVPVAPASMVPPVPEVPPCTLFIEQMDEPNRIATEDAKFMEQIVSLSQTNPDGSKRPLNYFERYATLKYEGSDAMRVPHMMVHPDTEVPPCTAFNHLMDDEPNRIAVNIWSTQGEKKFMEHIFSETMPDGSKRGLTYAEMRERYG